MTTDPALFYTGLVAELYRSLRSSDPDPAPYAAFVEQAGGPALELGCGDGDPMLELRRRGLDVEGLDSSAEMLDRCRARADEAGLSVVLHHARMESFDLGRQFGAIYLAGASFNLLPDDDAARAALRCIRRHLQPDGAALIPLMIPGVVNQREVGRVREATEPDGSSIRFSITAVRRDEDRRLQETFTRYERVGRDATVLERPWLVHWHTQDGFRALAADAGLAVEAVLGLDGAAATPTAPVFVFRLRAA